MPGLNLGLLPSLLARRAHLSAQGTTVYRGIHTSETDGLYVLDLAASVGVLSLYSDLGAAQEQRLAEACAQAGNLSSVYLKRRPVQASHLANVARDWLSPRLPIWGTEQAEITALEGSVPFLIRPAADLSIGLFSDARPARAWVRTHAPARVLNTFAYTCGFGLNAALGGADTVKNVDLSRKVLVWGQQNYRLSGLAAPDSDFLYGDVFQWLTRLKKRGDSFDLVVLDPPSFARGDSGVWRAERDYGRLVALAASVTAPGGHLLAMLNHAGVDPAALQHLVRQGLGQVGRQGRLLEQFGAGEDYPQATHLKVQVWQLDA